MYLSKNSDYLLNLIVLWIVVKSAFKYYWKNIKQKFLLF